jgi:hypothetical protein
MSRYQRISYSETAKFLYENLSCGIAAELEPPDPGELKNALGPGFAWLDIGTFE